MLTSRTGCLLLGLVFALVCVAGLWYLAARMNAGVLAGETTHDFGEMMIDYPPKQLQHTFHLTNKTGEPVNIAAIRPDCGCMTTERQGRVVQPGETFDLPVTMSFGGGEKTVLIRLDLQEHGIQVLKVKAAGYLRTRLATEVASVSLSPQQPANIALSADVYGTLHEPPAPIISAPPGVEAAFKGWRLKWKPKDAATVPAQWQGSIDVRQTADALTPDAAIGIELKPAWPLRLPIQPPQESGAAPAPPPQTETQPASFPADH